ncbi:MAG: hypothetical protein AAGE05_13910 [Pseudomonadota bacterium]
MADTLRFSPSTGWDEVRQLLGRELQLLVAIAGVFFLLPGLALSFMLPPVEDVSSLEAIVAVIQPYLPLIILVSLIQMIGQLAIWTLVMAVDRPTVGDAIKAALLFLPFYFLINILSNLIVGAGLLLFILPGIYLACRLAPIGVIAITEGIRNPLTAIQRSFAVTKGNALPIFAFLAIVGIVFILISFAVSIVFGTVFALVGLELAPGGTGSSLLSVITGIVSAAGTTIFALMQVSIYRQLTGPHTPEVFA